VNKIPQYLLKRLGQNLSHRFSVSQLIEKFEQFNQKANTTLHSLERKFPPHPFYRQPQKLLFAHGLTTIATLALFPPAPDVPPIAIPIVFASSFCLAYIMTALRIV
jgi:hypothetical protein